jgi:hypothetical protein
LIPKVDVHELRQCSSAEEDRRRRGRTWRRTRRRTRREDGEKKRMEVRQPRHGIYMPSAC